MKKTALAIAVLAMWSPAVSFANETPAKNKVADLGEIQITVEQVQLNAHPLDKPDQLTNGIVIDDHLKKRGANLGDALAKEVGIHASSFGGGASAPVIRGQEGKRIKILNNGTETFDMSAMSPDHAVAVDSMLAKQIEIVRGVAPLLYSSGNSAGLINVVDDKIPTKPAKQPITAEVGTRFNLADREKLYYGALTANLGSHFVAQVKGMKRDAEDYKTPEFWHEELLHKKLDDSFSASKSGSLGVSWVGERGYLGVAVSERKDKYGLPAHDHFYDDYDIEVLYRPSFRGRGYLKYYPFLADETDIFHNNAGIKCRTASYHGHPFLCSWHTQGHSHGLGGHIHVVKDEHDHDHDNPHIAMDIRRYDVKGEWKQPLKGLDRIRFLASQADYRHDEKTGAVVDNAFENQGKTARLEFVHSPMTLFNGELTGLLGGQAIQQKQHAINTHAFSFNRQHLLDDHKATNKSVFWLERLTWDTVQAELGARAEKQVITMAYNAEIKRERELPPKHLTAPHKSTAYSYAGSLSWQPKDRHKVSLTLSHQERLPNAQELYAHGKHLATNSFDTGNKDLNKEKSNNLDVTWAFSGDKWDFKWSNYYHDFDNYIYLSTLNAPDRRLCANNICYAPVRAVNPAFALRINRYYQSKAKIWGTEGEIGYQITPYQRVALFGDYVRGKLQNLPALPSGYDLQGNVLGWYQQPDGNAPRMPATRLGLKLDSQFGEHLNSQVEVVRTFAQNKVAYLENPTQGHTLLNASLSYDGKWGKQSYGVFMNANNILNAKAYNHASFLSYIPQMGRSVNMGVKLKF